MLTTIKQYLGAKIPSFNQKILFHFFLVLILLCVHFGFHFMDFLHLRQTSQNFFEGTLILTSMDAYHYAKGMREFLSLFNAKLELGAILDAFLSFHLLALLGGMFAKLTSLEFALTWSSVFFSSSTAFVIYLLVYQIFTYFTNPLSAGQNWQDMKQLSDKDSTFLFPSYIAFLATLIAILVPSFYQRVGVGYFDTDMLLLTLPLLSFIFLLRFLTTPHLSFWNLAFFGIFGYLAITWHHGLQNLFLVGFFLFVFLEIMGYIRKKTISLNALVLIPVLLIILTPSPFCLLVLVLFLVGIWKFPKLWLWIFLGLGYAVAFGLFNPLLSQINAYLFGATQYASTYVYTPVVNKILETMPASLSVLAERSGGIVLFGVAMLGFFCYGIFSFCQKFNFCIGFCELLESDSKIPLSKELRDNSKVYESLFSFFLFLLPFALLGLGSIKLGVRFSFFLTPVIALGFAFLLFCLLNLSKRFFTQILMISSAIVAFFVANLQYQIPSPILTQAEIKAFKELDFKLKPQDILLSWWDYGYALRYFTKAQILLDGARHSGAVNFPIATALLSSSPILFHNLSLSLAQAMQMLPPKEWNQIFEILSQDKGARKYLQALESESKPLKLADNAKVYWVLPLRIVPLMANINAFANLNLNNGQILKKETFVFWDSKCDGPKIIPQDVIHLYDDFYTKFTNLQVNMPLTQINFGENSLLLSNHYLKSNMIQILLFQNYPEKISVSGDIVRVLQLN